MKKLNEKELLNTNGGNPILNFVGGYVGGKVVDYVIKNKKLPNKRWRTPGY